MKHAHLAKVGIYLATFLLMFFLGLSISLESALALTLSPAKIEVEVDPGTSVTKEFLVLNEQTGSRVFYTSAENFQAQGESSTPFFVKEDKDLASWIQVDPEVDVKAGEQKIVHFTITVPQDAEPGGHFAAVFLSTSPSGTSSGQVSVGAKIGVLVLLKVKGDVKQGGGVVEFNTQQKKSFYESLPVSFFYRYQNSGGDRVLPTGNLIIKNILGWRKATIVANPVQGNILPNSIRRFETSWGELPKDAQNRNFFQTAYYQLTHFAFGCYRATLALEIEGIKSTSTPSIIIFVIPWQLTLLVVLILGIVGTIGTYGIKAYNKWIISKARG